jgi:hypothetical protein
MPLIAIPSKFHTLSVWLSTKSFFWIYHYQIASITGSRTMMMKGGSVTEYKTVIGDKLAITYCVLQLNLLLVLYSKLEH